jgi:hypothetical protein
MPRLILKGAALSKRAGLLKGAALSKGASLLKGAALLKGASALLFTFYLLPASPLAAQTVVSYPVITGPVAPAAEFQSEAAEFYTNVLIELQYQGSVLNAFSVMETARLNPVPTLEALSASDQAARPHYAVTMHVDRVDSTTRSFTLRVWDLVATAYPYTEYSISYSDPDEVLSTMPFSVWQITSVLPVNYTYPDGYIDGDTGWVMGDPVIDENAWKTSWLYLGLQAGISVRMYGALNSQSVGMSFTPGVHLEFQAAAFQLMGTAFTFSLQTVISFGQEVAYFQKSFPVTDENDEVFFVPVQVEYSAYSLTLPLLFKLSFKPNRFIIGPYAGAYYILPMGGSAPYTPPWGISLGVELGLHAGPGLVFLDLNLSADVGESLFKGTPDIPYHRIVIAASLGYSFGIGGRK